VSLLGGDLRLKGLICCQANESQDAGNRSIPELATNHRSYII
jgi:hypothetical protein